MNLTWNIVLALSVAIAVTCGSWLLMEVLCGIRVEPRRREAGPRPLPGGLRWLLPLSVNLRRIARQEGLKRQVQMVERQLGMAGYGESISAVDFVAVKLTAWTVGIFILIGLALAGFWLVGAIFGLYLGLYPGLWLNRTIRTRHREIVRALPNVLDLLTLSIEAGKDFMSSLRDILLRRRLDALGEELERTFQEIQLGKKRSTALREMNDRVQQEDFSSVIQAIIQAEELGVSVGQLLKIQGDMLRHKRFTRAEKMANEAPVKMLAPMFLFIFPAVVVILAVALGSQLLNLL